MEIEILTYGKKRKELILSMANFFAKQLNVHKSNYKVYIVTDPTLNEQGNNGICAKTGERELSIVLYSRLSFGKLIYTLAHEMVHVKQFVRGHYRQENMKYGKGVYHYWLGKRVNLEYHKRPWEIEAMSRESVLVGNLTAHVEKLNKKGKNKA
jgi:hypothetical protein